METNETNEFEVYVCEICNREVENLDDLEFHYNIYHENKCVVCDKTFLTIKMLDVHSFEMHDVFSKLKSSPTNSESKYKCIADDCALAFATKRDRFNHLISVHNFHKCDLLYFSDYLDSHELAQELTKKATLTHLPPKQVCFGEEAEKAFPRRYKRIAKRMLLNK